MAKPVILVVAAVGFQPIEYHDTKMALEDADITVITASDTAGPAVASDGKTTAVVDHIIQDLNIEHYDGIFLIGGPGALEHLDNPKLLDVVKEAKKLKIPHGAICISPRILAQAGILANKRATGWNEDNKLQEIFSKHHVLPTLDKSVVTDGIVVTATGPRAATAFGQAIAQVVTAYRATQSATQN